MYFLRGFSCYFNLIHKIETWKAECQVFIIFVQYTPYSIIICQWIDKLDDEYIIIIFHHFSVWFGRHTVYVCGMRYTFNAKWRRKKWWKMTAAAVWMSGQPCAVSISTNRKKLKLSHEHDWNSLNFRNTTNRFSIERYWNDESAQKMV